MPSFKGMVSVEIIMSYCLVASRKCISELLCKIITEHLYFSYFKFTRLTHLTDILFYSVLLQCLSSAKADSKA